MVEKGWLRYKLRSGVNLLVLVGLGNDAVRAEHRKRLRDERERKVEAFMLLE